MASKITSKQTITEISIQILLYCTKYTALYPEVSDNATIVSPSKSANTQDDYDTALEQYGGKLEIVFSDDGSTVQMVQGGGTLDGVCEYHYEDEGVRLTFDNNGTDLLYACVFADFDGLTMVALSDTSGYNAVYFVTESL